MPVLVLSAVLVSGFGAGCAMTGASLGDGDHVDGYGVTFYEPFDNSRDYGPAYLVGPPLRDKQYANDHGNRTADSVLVPNHHSDDAPSIPTSTPDLNPPPSPLP